MSEHTQTLSLNWLIGACVMCGAAGSMVVMAVLDCVRKPFGLNVPSEVLLRMLDCVDHPEARRRPELASARVVNDQAANAQSPADECDGLPAQCPGCEGWVHAAGGSTGRNGRSAVLGVVRKSRFRKKIFDPHNKEKTMQNEYYCSGEYVRSAVLIDGVINALYAHVSGAEGDRALEQHGLARVCPPPEMDGELCLAAHHRRLVTQREHVWHVLDDSQRVLFGRVRLHHLESGNKLGEPVLSIVVRHDGCASFDGSVDVDTAIIRHGYAGIMLDRFARAVMRAIHASLAQVK